MVSVQLETTVEVTTNPVVDDGDHERFTHIVLEGYTPKRGEFVPLENSVVDAMVNSTPVRALCGKVWVPGRDPAKVSRLSHVQGDRRIARVVAAKGLDPWRLH